MPQTLQQVTLYCAYISAMFITGVVLITVLNAAGFIANSAARFTGGNVPGLPGYEDAVSLLIGNAALLMLPYCQLARGHVSVDLFTDWMSTSLLSGLTRLTDFMMSICAAFLSVMLAKGMITYLSDGALTPVLGWPIWPFLVPGIFATALWALVALLMAVWPPTELDPSLAQKN